MSHAVSASKRLKDDTLTFKDIFGVWLTNYRSGHVSPLISII